jgi:hypothetical protein
VEPLELDVLATEDAARFLLERTERARRRTQTDEADAGELARELGGLALALEQAGAYIVQRRLSLADYLAKWRGHVPGVVEWHDERIMKYPRSVAVTWQTTIDQLGAGEVALLSLLGWMAPEPLPLFVLEADGAEALWQEAVGLVSEGSATSGGLFKALTALSSYSMVRWDAEEQSVSVHRVVQEDQPACGGGAADAAGGRDPSGLCEEHRTPASTPRGCPFRLRCSPLGNGLQRGGGRRDAQSTHWRGMTSPRLAGR